jgi:hypothetical protein
LIQRVGIFVSRLFVIFVPLIVLACNSDQSSVTDQLEVWLIQDVSIIDVESGSIIPNQSVVVKGNKIASVGPSADMATPAGARMIDGTGKFLIPGLWDAHIHTSGNAESRNAILPLLIANGVTGARSMAGDCHIDIEDGGCGEPVATISDVRKWREEIVAGTLVGPRIVASSFYTNGPDSLEESSVINPGNAEHARAYARLLNDRGVDLIKVYSGMYREAFFAVADEARGLGLEFGGHVPLTVRASEASDAGMATIEHITGILEECSTKEEALRPTLVASYQGVDELSQAFWPTLVELAESFDDQKCQQLYERLAANGTWHIPTLNVDAFYAGLELPRQDWRDDSNIKYVPRIEVELWNRLEHDYFEGVENYKQALQPHFQKSFEITQDTHRAGVPMMAGSDAGEYGIVWGFGLHDELEFLVVAGLSELEALQAATLSPARYRGMEDQLGTVEKGKLADLVLLSANPLEDISNTQAIDIVIADGRVYRRSELDALLNKVEEYARSTWEDNGSETN